MYRGSFRNSGYTDKETALFLFKVARTVAFWVFGIPFILLMLFFNHWLLIPVALIVVATILYSIFTRISK